MTNIVSLKKTVVADDIVRGLRRLADGIEAGTEVDWPITSCIIVIGHTQQSVSGDMIEDQSFVESYGLGPRCDDFTKVGLLMRAMK